MRPQKDGWSMISSVSIAKGTTTTSATIKTSNVIMAPVVSLMVIMFSIKSSTRPAIINSKMRTLVLVFILVIPQKAVQADASYLIILQPRIPRPRLKPFGCLPLPLAPYVLQQKQMEGVLWRAHTVLTMHSL